MSYLTAYNQHLLDRGLSDEDAIDRLAMVQNKFASAAQRKWYFANLAADKATGGGGGKGKSKNGGGGGAKLNLFAKATNDPTMRQRLIDTLSFNYTKKEVRGGAKQAHGETHYEVNTKKGTHVATIKESNIPVAHNLGAGTSRKEVRIKYTDETPDDVVSSVSAAKKRIAQVLVDRRIAKEKAKKKSEGGE